MMTKYNHKHQPKSNLLDRIYYSCSVEFWLAIVTIGIAADWIFKFGTSSLLITLAWTGILGTYLVYSNRTAGDLWYNFRRIKAPQHLSLLVAGLTVLCSLFLITCMTDPAHALIITASGTKAITDLLSGTGLGVTNTALAGFATFVINFVKVSFAIAFIFGLKDAYDKTRERAELQDIVQAPIVLIAVVIAIDAVMGMIFGAV
jgi:hypothetical protein